MQSCLVLILNLDRIFPPAILSPKILALVDFLGGLLLSLSGCFQGVLSLYSLSVFYGEECFPFPFLMNSSLAGYNNFRSLFLPVRSVQVNFSRISSINTFNMLKAIKGKLENDSGE